MYIRGEPSMSSSEIPRCKECSQSSHTIEALEEHVEEERKEKAFRNKGFDDG
jgi:phage FluMu protein Com